MIGISFFNAYLIYFHSTDGVQSGIGKLNSPAETLNLRKEAWRGEGEERGQSVPAPSTVAWWRHMRKFGKRTACRQTSARRLT
jgi:hypothetical protein